MFWPCGITWEMLKLIAFAGGSIMLCTAPNLTTSTWHTEKPCNERVLRHITIENFSQQAGNSCRESMGAVWRCPFFDLNHGKSIGTVWYLSKSLQGSSSMTTMKSNHCNNMQQLWQGNARQVDVGGMPYAISWVVWLGLGGDSWWRTLPQINWLKVVGWVDTLD